MFMVFSFKFMFISNNITYASSCVFFFSFLLIFQRRDIFQDLAPLLWHSFGTIAALLQVFFFSGTCSSIFRGSWFIVSMYSFSTGSYIQEITSVYSLLTPPKMTSDQSNRVCNALALLQVHYISCCLSLCFGRMTCSVWKTLISIDSTTLLLFSTSSVLLLILKRECCSLTVQSYARK